MPERQDPGLTRRSLLAAVALTILAGLWIRQAEIVVLATQISESVPAIPGLAALVLLLALNALLRFAGRRLPWARPLTRGELLTIFLFVTIASTVVGVGVERFLLALLCAPFYFTVGDIGRVRPSMPGWMAPHNLEVIRQLYEGSPSGQVPWRLWWQPGLIWLGFFLALWCAMYCLMALFYRSWAQEERLSFPLVFLPVEMTGGESGEGGFFRNRMMWAGFGTAALYNLVNIAHALNPSLPAFGKEIDFSPAFPDPPWNAAVPLAFRIRPEMIGLGYLVSTEISLTAWVSFVAMKLAAVIGAAAGYPAGRLPYAQEQGMGAFMVLMIMAVWLARRQLMRSFRDAFAGRQAVGPEGISARWAWAGLVGGFLVVWGFVTLAGMAGWVAFTYLALVLGVAMVYGRLRAEAGVPLVWLFPYYMQKKALLYSFGSHPFLASGEATLPVWALFTFLARGYFPEMTGYQVEGMELARRAGINPRRLAFSVLLAVAVGFAIGWYNHLAPYYHYGAQQLRGGIWGTPMAIQEYQAAAHYRGAPQLPDQPQIWATGVGAAVALGLSLLRLRFAAFPLHALGYAMTCSYGDLVWGPFLVVWLLKTLALRWGGMAFYRKTVPLMLGLALGHFAVAGIFWGLTGAWFGDATRGYPVFFG
jgi:hypothetical protein